MLRRCSPFGNIVSHILHDVLIRTPGVLEGFYFFVFFLKACVVMSFSLL